MSRQETLQRESYVEQLIHADRQLPSTTPTIIFVLGGPGAGKGTQCSRLAQQYHHVHHISVGDVLRAEARNRSSEFARTIAENMRNGTIGPMEVTVEILRRAIETIVRDSESDKSIVILLDGFPRKKDQLQLFEAVVQPTDFAIFIECEDQVRLERLSRRAKHAGNTRQDDDPETIQKRSRNDPEAVSHFHSYHHAGHSLPGKQSQTGPYQWRRVGR